MPGKKKKRKKRSWQRTDSENGPMSVRSFVRSFVGPFFTRLWCSRASACAKEREGEREHLRVSELASERIWNELMAG